MRVVMVDKYTGIEYSIRADTLKRRQGRKTKVKFAKPKTSNKSVTSIFSRFNETADTGLVSSSFGSILQAIADGDCSSISLTIYRDEFQITFWEKNGKSSTVLASRSFLDPEGFIAAVEELS